MTTAISVVDVQKKYKTKQVLRGISFEIRQGDVFILLGPNGCGKTTTIRILLNLLLPDEGTAHIHGVDVTKDFDRLKKRLGVLSSEKSYLINHYSLRTNLRMFGRLYGVPAKEIDSRIGELASSLGLESCVDQKVSTFSWGMKNKANLCRCLLHRPDVLILDEPTSSMDVPSVTRVHELIRSAARAGCTILATTHNMTEASDLADHIGFVSGGKILLAGSRDDVLRKCAHYSIRMALTVDAPDRALLALRNRGVTVDGNGHGSVGLVCGEAEVDSVLREVLAVTTVRNVSTEPTSLSRLFDLFGGEAI